MGIKEKARQAYYETVNTRTSAPFLLRHGSDKISNWGIIVTIVGAMICFAPFWIPIVTNYWDTPSSILIGLMIVGGIIMSAGLIMVRVSRWTWWYEFREISNYREISFREFIRFMFVGIRREEVPVTPDGRSLYVQRGPPQYYQYNPQQAAVSAAHSQRQKRMIPQTHRCPSCKAKIMPGDELCTSCG